MLRAKKGRKGVARTIIVLAASAIAAGCASLTHRPLDPGDPSADDDARGIRYYETSLYLLVYSDGRGGLVSRIVELPDPTKLRVAEPRSFLARIDGKLELRDGALRSAREEPDSTALPAAIIDAATSAVRTGLLGPRRGAGGIDGAGDVGGIGTPSAGTGTVPSTLDEALFPAPYLYKIRVREGGVEFLGGQGDAPVRISLGPGTARTPRRD